MNEEITNEMLDAYLDDCLTESEEISIEKALRESESLRQKLQQIRENRNYGEHSLGAIWRRERLTCPSREELTKYILGVLDQEHQDYIQFHLQTIHCPTCLANWDDLRQQHQEDETTTKKRRQRTFDSSCHLIPNKR